MEQFKYYQSIQIRYNDIDAQGHVNNAKYVTFLEFARFRYITEIGLWNGESFMELGLIVADVHVKYLAPIMLNQAVKIGVKVSTIGNKSMIFKYQFEDSISGQVMATAETVMVSFDYKTQSTTLISKKWRELISKFEGLVYE